MKNLSTLVLGMFLLAGLTFASLTACNKENGDKQKAADDKTQPVKTSETVKPPVDGRLPAKPTEPAKIETVPAPPAVIPEAKIVVENAGGDNKVALRYLYKATDVTVAMMELKMGMQISMGAVQQPAVALPLMKMNMKITNREVKESGNLLYDFLLDSVDVVGDDKTPQGMIDSMKNALNDIKGMNGSAEVTTRGITVSAEMKMPSNTNPQLTSMMENMRQQMNQMSVPLPEAPVGPGATWTVTTQMTSGGILMTNQYKYTLTKLEGTNIEMKVELVQSAEPQELKNPNLPAGTVIHMQEFKSSGNGTVKMDLTRMVPTSEITSETKMKMEVEAGGQKQNLEQTMTLGLKLYPEQK
ncbi:hypothetical protein KKD52_08575 [Myxococcota bacterium]|nr:hypothetical protein [Myxococcota bacterium]MBU1410160.1 hypothetical protein [Myxococcota bacterium]MBU1510401.1 hypothetical protein [Myxococcota bacterium]